MAAVAVEGGCFGAGALAVFLSFCLFSAAEGESC